MTRNTLARLTVGTLLSLVATVASAQVQDPSFEQHVVPASGNLAYQYSGYQPGPPTTPAPAFNSPWTFGPGSGLIRGTGTDFNTPSPFPEGNQVAFLQGNGSYIEQSLNLAPGVYTLSYFVGGRQATGGYDGDTFYNVSFGGNVIGLGSTQSYQPWGQFLLAFSTSGAGTLRFDNVSRPGDHTFFLDEVSVSPNVTATPEPASLALVGSGLIALGGAVIRRRRA